MDFKKRNKEILKMRAARYTFQEIGNNFNLSKERVRQIEVILNKRTVKKNGEKLKKIYEGGGRERAREIVRKRDNYTCQKCFKKWQKGTRKLDVNHIDEKIDTHAKETIRYDKENPDKLITLCHKCHFKWHKEMGHTKNWKGSSKVSNFII